MVFSNHPFCVLGVFHSKEGWQFASFEILTQQSSDHVFRADLIECRRNWFNWWAGWWCRLKFYSILSIEIQTYQPHCTLHISWPLGWNEGKNLITELLSMRFLISMPIGITVGWPSVFMSQSWLGSGENHPWMTHDDPYWSMVIPTRLVSKFIPWEYSRIFQDPNGKNTSSLTIFFHPSMA